MKDLRFLYTLVQWFLSPSDLKRLKDPFQLSTVCFISYKTMSWLLLPTQ